jgi:hypothetical protein
MRGADTFTESLFSVRRLDDFVSQNHPLRPVRQMVNETLKRIAGEHFSVDGTLIQACAGHKSFQVKRAKADSEDGEDDGGCK